MRSFADTPTCATRRHCVDCRSSNAHGVVWRKAMGAFAEVPAVCPHGVAVDVAENPPAVKVARSGPVDLPPLVSVSPGQLLMRSVGPSLWAEIHQKLDADAAFIDYITRSLPCGECRGHWLELLAFHPPAFGHAWFEWSVIAHNIVNLCLGKPELSLAGAEERWVHGTRGMIEAAKTAV